MHYFSSSKKHSETKTTIWALIVHLKLFKKKIPDYSFGNTSENILKKYRLVGSLESFQKIYDYNSEILAKVCLKNISKKPTTTALKIPR